MNIAKFNNTTFSQNSKSYILYLSIIFFTIVILIVDLLIPLGVAGGVPYITIVLLSLWIPNKKATIFLSIICSLLTIVGFYYSPEGGEMWKVILNRSLALYAIWVTASLTLQRKIIEEKREKIVEEREKALNDVRVLQGFLPICASCKNIRDDKGYWNQIEEYITKNSEANFSHGICPDCAKKLYPDYFTKIESE